MDQQPHTVINKSFIPPPLETPRRILCSPSTSVGAATRNSMSKASIASAKTPTQLPSQSPWAKGPPPNSNPSAPSPRSQSPVPSHVPSPITISHTRRPSALGQGVPIEKGVSVPRNNVDSVRQGSAAVAFGSIDETSPPLSSSPAATPVVKAESVKSFGSVPATPATYVNGKFPVPLSNAGPSKLHARPTSSSTSSVTSPSTTSTTSSSAISASAKPTLNRAEIAKLFQGTSSAPQQQSSDTSSPSTRPSNLPPYHQPSSSGKHPPQPPAQPSQLGPHQFAQFVPGMRSLPRAVPNGTGASPRPMAATQAKKEEEAKRKEERYHQQPLATTHTDAQGGTGDPAIDIKDTQSLRDDRYSDANRTALFETPANRWSAVHRRCAGRIGYPDLVESKVRALLNKLTPEKFDSISDQIIAWANKSENERDAKTLNQVIRVVFEQVVHGPACIEIYARLCRKMMERISPEVQDDGIRNTEGKPIASGQLFRIYLLNHSQEDFERSWVTKEATKLDECYGAQRTRCHRLGLIKFIGELSKLQMLPERIMHECVKKLLRNVENPEEEKIESLCQLLKTVGQQLDVPKARAHMDVYFTRMKELCKSLNVSPRVQFLLQDVIELRDRKWAARGIVVVPTTLSAVNEAVCVWKFHANKITFSQQDDGHGFDAPGAAPIFGAAFEPVVPLKISANRWVAASTVRKPVADTESPELVDRKVRSLLNKLTMEKFDSISDQIITWANNSKNERDGRTLIQVIRLVFERATDEAAWNEMYARLCRKMMERISPEVQDDGIKNTEGKPIAGGQLFRKYLLNRCQEDFERGWVAKEATTAAAAAKASDDQAIKAANETKGEESELYSEEYYAAQKAKRQGLGLIKFIGELFKLQLLTERIMHECVKKLLGNPENPEEEEIESLCQLLKTVGQQLDVPKARAHMDVYFTRMKELCKNPNISPRMQFLLQDVIELRDRKWAARGIVVVPTTLSADHKAVCVWKFHANKIAFSEQGDGHGFDAPGAAPIFGAAFEPVVPLKKSANRWVAASTVRKRVADTESPELVDRKVRSLLNKLTMEKFDSISDQIIAWANRSVDEKDGRTLIQVIRLVFEKATDEAAWNEMYARLCRKMMERISPEVQDDGIKNTEGKPIAGGQLFRKYLLNRCQEDFERSWVAKEATAAAAAAKASDDEAIKAANEKKGEESELYAEEYYAQKARRQGLGLIKFIGELFKLQMLTERIMHECVKKLLGNAENPEEEEIESLCQLLKTVGQQLDVPKARAHMDVYLTRMKELCKNPNVRPRMQFLLQDVIELRDRKWAARGIVVVPTTLSAVHEAALKEKATADAQSYQRQLRMSRGGLVRRGDERNVESGPDGWHAAGSSVPRPPPKAGDLSQFGKISKGAGAPMVMGPSIVFAKKDPNIKRGLLSRTSWSPDLFPMLSQNPELVVDTTAKFSRPPSRKPSVDLGQGGPPEPVQRKKLQLLPRSKPAAADPPASEDEAEVSDEMSEADAKKKIDENVEEFFAVRDMEEADVYFSNLPEAHRFRLVDKLVGSALESKEADAVLVSEFFAQASSKGQCSFEVFEAGFMPMAEILDDIAIDAPNAFKFMAIMLKGAGFDRDEERLAQIVGKSMDGDKLLQLVAS